MKFLTTVCILVASCIAVGVPERPTFPEPEEDKVLLKGKTLDEFFGERSQNQTCSSKFEEYQAAYQKAEEAIKKDTPEVMDRKAPGLEAQRTALLKWVEACGPCATRPIENIEIEGSARTEYWLRGDGTCYLGGPGKTVPADFVERAKASLLNPKRYARYQNGFRAILEFTPLDYVSGKALTIDQFTTFPSYAHLVAIGIEFLNFVTSYDQVYKITARDVASGFEIRYEGVPVPSTYSPAPVYFYSRSKMKKTTVQAPSPVANSYSSWFVRKDGLSRYFHATDFGETAKFAKDRAQWLLQDTGYTKYEMARGWK